MSTYDLSQYGRRLQKFFKDSLTPNLSALVEESKELGYPIELSALHAAIHRNWSPCDLNLVRGPAEALGLSPKEAMELSHSYVFDPTIGPRPNS